MNNDNYKDKINQLLDYKELLSFYAISEEIADPNSKRAVMDQIDSDIDFYVRLSLEEGSNLSLMN